MTKILYIIDNKVQTDKFIKYIKSSKSKSACKSTSKSTDTSAINDRLAFYICPITTDNDIVCNTRQKLSGCGDVVILPFISKFHDNGFLYKDKFIKFLSDFSSGRHDGLISLRKYFAYPFGDFSTWWFSLIAEKDTAKNQMYHNFVKLITIFDFVDDYSIDEIYIDLEDNNLKSAILRNKQKKRITARIWPKDTIGINLIEYFIKALGYFVFFIIRKCLLFIIHGKDINKRIDSLKDSDFLLITFFPFSADGGLLKKNIFKNKVFGPLQESLEKRYKDRITWFGIEKEYSGLNIEEIKLAKKINVWGYNFFLMEELISLRKMIVAFFIFLFLSFKFLIKIPYLSRNFIFDYKKRINLWDLFQEGWIYSFLGSNLIGGLLYYHIFSNIMLTVKNEAIVIYPSELQWWENILNIAVKGNKRIRTLGIQHSSVPPLFLSYFNFPLDLNCTDGFDVFPLPDYLATSGSIPSKLLVDSGWPKRKIFDMGAIKYHRLLKFLEKEIEWSQREKRIVVALSFMKEETSEMLLMLKQSFRNEDICTFVIKPHPAMALINDIIKATGIDSFGNKFILDVDTPLENLLVSSRAVILVSSTVSLDAIACQCPVVIPKLSCMLDTNPLSNVAEGLIKYADNQDELKVTIKSILDSEKSPIEFSKCKSFFNDYFTILDNEDEYFMRLKRELLDK
jgi:surface carbohydrate biosynthesis protein (TIGR04326 family)